MTVSTGNEFTPERVGHLAHSINERLSESIDAIEDVNSDIHVLSINAKIQAARAGTVGAGFGVVADEIRKLVNRTQQITSNLQVNVEDTIKELMTINELLGTRVRGQRLSQVANTCIDIVDRNLYERSCDVRWWATEDALVEALTSQEPAAVARASERLGIILDSYTVYLDLVLCDLSGRVIANGRPKQFPSVGMQVADKTWFFQARSSKSGTQFGFEGMHNSPLVSGKTVLVYSCGVRRDGNADGELIGVLGIIFNWAELGNVVVKRAEEMLCPETEQKVCAYLTYPDGTIIASSSAEKMLQRIPLSDPASAFKEKQGYLLERDSNGNDALIGYALSPGFETYRTGWYAVIFETREAQESHLN